MAVPYFLPLWRISLIAPQYPEGLGMRIGISSVEGAKPNDLNNINGLNHYIGMKPIEADAIPELRFMPWILAALLAGAVAVAVTGRRRLLKAWVSTAFLVSIAGLADFWWWGYKYGHELDPETAIIKIPGMTYQPPLIGSKQLLNFTAVSWPDLGGIALALGIALGVVALWLSRTSRSSVPRPDAAASAPPGRRRSAPGRASAVTAAVLMSALAVAAEPDPVAAQPARGRGDTIVVSPHGAVRTIGRAVRLADSGATVLVRRGVYREATIVVDRPLTMIGDSLAILDGDSVNAILVIEADDVTVRGLTFRNVGFHSIEDRAAIRAGEVSGCRIEANRIEDSYFAIYLAGTSRCLVAGNRIRGAGRGEAHSGNGIHLWTTRDLRIVDNDIRGHRDGIYLEFARASDIVRNRATGNRRYGLHFMYSDSCAYRDNVFDENAAGVAVMYSRTVEMVGNRFERGWGATAYGLLLKDVFDARIARNVFRRNRTALVADAANRIQADSNDFIENGWAVRVLASTDDGRFRANNFIGNTFDVTTNASRLSSRFEGNYWDAYRGYDLDRDGSGDIAHRPMRLFALLVENSPSTIVLLRTPIVSLLDAAELVLPALTPERLVDERPAIRRIAWSS